MGHRCVEVAIDPNREGDAGDYDQPGEINQGAEDSFAIALRH
jgi:hypothetical protein